MPVNRRNENNDRTEKNREEGEQREIYVRKWCAFMEKEKKK